MHYNLAAPKHHSSQARMTSSSQLAAYHPSPTDHATYTRSLGGGELPGALAISNPGESPREPIRIHIFAHLTSSKPPTVFISKLRRAWLALRLLHEPDIATTFSSADQTKIYSVPDESEAEAWLTRTFLIASENEAVEAIVRTEQSRTELLPVVHIIPDANSSEPSSFSGTVLILASHWRTEASGVYKILDTLFALAAADLQDDEPATDSTAQSLAAHRPGDEVQLLTPPAEDMVQPNPTTSPTAVERIAAAFRTLESRLPCIEIPTKPAPGSGSGPGPVGVVRRIYSVVTTDNLLVGSRAAGVTLTAAIHAAYIGAIYPLTPANDGRWYASMMPAEIRTRLLAPDSNSNSDADSAAAAARWRTQGCWNAAQMLLLTAPPNVGLVERAQALKACYDTTSRKEWMNEEFREWNRQMAAFHATAGIASSAVPWFTSLGVLERGLLRAEFGEGNAGANTDESVIRVSDVHGWADPMGVGCVLTMWTWRGRLNVQISWNTAFHEQETMDRILDGMEEAVQRELGVAMEEFERKSFEY